MASAKEPLPKSVDGQSAVKVDVAPSVADPKQSSVDVDSVINDYGANPPARWASRVSTKNSTVRVKKRVFVLQVVIALFIGIIVMIAIRSIIRRKKGVTPEQKAAIEDAGDIKKLEKIVEAELLKVKAQKKASHPTPKAFEKALVENLGWFDLSFSEKDWMALALFFVEEKGSEAADLVEKSIIPSLRVGDKDQAKQDFAKAVTKLHDLFSEPLTQVFDVPLPEKVVTELGINDDEKWEKVIVEKSLNSSESIAAYCKENFEKNRLFHEYQANRVRKLLEVQAVREDFSNCVSARRVIQIWKSLVKPGPKVKSKL